ncbi:MAG: zinc ribbon domain-containing protein [Actinomycetota bacterium]
MGTERVLALQEIDTAIDRLRARQRALESGEVVAGARAAADEAEIAYGELRLQIDELDRDQRRYESELDSLTQKEAAEQKRMFDGSIANAKELAALQHEIEALSKRRSDREDELLALMEQHETVDAAASDAESRSTELRAEVDRVSTEAGEELRLVTEELARRTADRDAIAPELDPELLELYEDLRRQKKGVGAAALVDGVCQACHEQLSAVELDKLKKTEGVRRCEYCRRILVF